MSIPYFQLICYTIFLIHTYPLHPYLSSSSIPILLLYTLPSHPYLSSSSIPILPAHPIHILLIHSYHCHQYLTSSSIPISLIHTYPHHPYLIPWLISHRVIVIQFLKMNYMVDFNQATFKYTHLKKTLTS